MTILFCHGLESGPHGRKYRALCAAGLEVQAPDCRGMNLAARVDLLLQVLAGAPSALLVGSSYGGLAALCAALLHRERGGSVHALVLCAPALWRSEPPADRLVLRAPAPTVILHGRRDEVVPVTLSQRFAADHPEVELIEVDNDHGLAGSLELLVATVQRLRSRHGETDRGVR